MSKRRNAVRPAAGIALLTAFMVAALTLFVGSVAGSIGPSTEFYVPKADHRAIEQIAALTSSGHKADATLIRKMIQTPQAVWLTGGTPKEVEQDVRRTMERATDKGTVPVLVAYDVPGRDCAQYSAGGAATGDEIGRASCRERT